MTTTKSNAMLGASSTDPIAMMRSVFAFVVVAFAFTQCVPAIAQSDVGSGKRRGVLIEFKEDINPLSGALLKRKFEAAVESDADVIILDIQSPGGSTSVTLELMDMVLEAKDVETVAYIEKDAYSGAAMLAISTDTILMRPDARMGDAGEIVEGADGAYRYTSAKRRSALAQKVRDTAEATGRPLALAEKMTDKDMVVYQATNKESGEKRYLSDKDLASREDADQWELSPPIREAGKEMFFTVNGRRGVELGMVDQTIESRDDLAKVLNLQEPIVEMERSWTDTLVFLLNSQFVTFLLLLIGLVTLAIELSAPGIGIGGLTSVLCFGLFFWARFLGGTSGWLEVVLFLMGILFIAAEVFVIPGFGVAGISGLALSLGALVMASRRFALPENEIQWTSLATDMMTVMGAFLGFLVCLAVMAKYLGDIPGLSRLTLRPQVMVAADGGASATLVSGPAWQRVEVGDTGSAMSPLRPSGKVQFGDDAVDVVTEGDYIDPGTEVRVVGKQGARVTVRKV
ncbi:NfeD family protein [Rhodopirellula baltica]|uniref:Nodulation efficiency, NfeD n=1 Tax=Rhodopirellula baltica WH47 TaxID=991778 RepID=F2APV1_RHOBT|nr:NfeD family protein [Rhodopirellula baltica]EGF28368.1 Nodulation efficiency, NfeD [Rhodopirellula baltica WH47]